MNFQLDSALLNRMLVLNHFEKPSGLVIFGIRGCLPERYTGERTLGQVEMSVEATDHTHPRCAIGIWDTSSGEILACPGSTVPHLRYIKEAKEKGGRGANQLMPGLYGGYTLGTHNAGKPTAHAALRQTKNQPARRTADDLDFDGDDRIEIGNPCDNIHSAWSMGPSSDFFGSAGCSVICGYPKTAKKDEPIGPYADWINWIKESGQEEYTYLLLEGRSYYKASAVKGTFDTVLRWGSKAEEVKSVQNVLYKEKLFKGGIDGQFGADTFEAVCKYQEQAFGKDADDGVVGPITAAAMGIKLPRVYYHGMKNYEVL